MSRDLQLAKMGALRWLPAELVMDEIQGELDAWTELGFHVLECGCMWRLEDIDDLSAEIMDHHEPGGVEPPMAAW